MKYGLTLSVVFAANADLEYSPVGLTSQLRSLFSILRFWVGQRISEQYLPNVYSIRHLSNAMERVITNGKNSGRLNMIRRTREMKMRHHQPLKNNQVCFHLLLAAETGWVGGHSSSCRLPFPGRREGSIVLGTVLTTTFLTEMMEVRTKI